MSGFEINESNQYIKKVYNENENYKIILNSCTTKRCIILFSGNGLYYPDTSDTFTAVVVDRDRYEWENVIRYPIIQETYQMVILIRDVYKTFYQKGINASLDTIDKVLCFLKKKTEGFQVVTCGNSAGGYMATIAGAYLNAYSIYNFGGQWDLSCEKGYFLDKCKEKKYFNIVEYAKENVIWFYSAYNEYDLLQKEYLNIDMVGPSVFAIASKYHGDYLLYPCYKVVLTLPLQEIKKLSDKYKDKIISQRGILREFLFGKELVVTYIMDIVNNHKSLQIIKNVIVKCECCFNNACKSKK